MSRSRQFTKVSPDVWASKRFRSLSQAGQLLLLYLMTCRHQNSTGAFSAPIGYLCADLSWSEAAVTAALQELTAASLVAYDDAEDEFFVHGWFLYNPPMNSKHAAGTQSLIASLKSVRISDVVGKELDDAINSDPVVSEAVKGRSKLTDTNYMRGSRRD